MYGDRSDDQVAIAARRRNRRRALIAAATAAIAVAVTAWLWWPEREPSRRFGREPTIDVAVLRGDTAVLGDRAAVGDRIVVRAPAAGAVWLYRDQAQLVACPDDTAAEADRCIVDGGRRVLTAITTAPGRHAILVVASLRRAPPTLDQAMAELTRDGVWFRRRELVVE